MSVDDMKGELSKKQLREDKFWSSLDDGTFWDILDKDNSDNLDGKTSYAPSRSTLRAYDQNHSSIVNNGNLIVVYTLEVIPPEGRKFRDLEELAIGLGTTCNVDKEIPISIQTVYDNCNERYNEVVRVHMMLNYHVVLAEVMVDRVVITEDGELYGSQKGLKQTRDITPMTFFNGDYELAREKIVSVTDKYIN